MLPSEELEELVKRLVDQDLIIINSKMLRQFDNIIDNMEYIESHLKLKGENHLLDQVRWVDDGL